MLIFNRFLPTVINVTMKDRSIGNTASKITRKLRDFALIPNVAKMEIACSIHGADKI